LISTGNITTTTTTTVLWPFYRDHPGERVPEENFWTLWCKGGLTEADTQIIRLGATPSGLTSAHLTIPPGNIRILFMISEHKFKELEVVVVS